MLDQLEELNKKALQELAAVTLPGELETWRVRYLGKKSELTGILRGLATLPLEERKHVGARGNQVKAALEAGHRRKEQELREGQLSLAGTGAIDITLPGKPWPVGHIHPITRTLYEVCDIFVSMGFKVVEGPDVEWDYYNFEALNIPKEHPARDTMSTFWADTGSDSADKQMLLRTHTTAVSARVVETMEPPIRVVEPGKVYRYEASDATHIPMFINFDGLAVDRGITMADLKGTLYEFSRRYFGGNRKVRFRCDFFPFVEPGVEMAVECLVCNGVGCRLCGNSGWIEILGAGMTHPEVLRRGGIDPDVYTSFAFGMGVERLHMLRHGIDDIRLYYGSDLRFLYQF
ncbi:MAG: phenylalanine--tRNA ligase subunit alpha [Dehalococcoidales bacterium]|nr:MAG: phenylalanine--tRNA ligase subunit alpha [Dehalococcoidales bacterium]